MVLSTVLLIPAVFQLQLMVGGAISLNCFESSDCPGNLVSCDCVATHTSFIRFLIGDKGDSLYFFSSAPPDRNFSELTITQNGVKTKVVAKLREKTCLDGALNSCSMKAVVIFPHWLDILNLTLSCQSRNETETTSITNGTCYIKALAVH